MAKTGSASTTRVSVERELAYHKEVSANVQSREIEPALGIAEYAEICCLVDDVFCVFCVIVLVDANENN